MPKAPDGSFRPSNDLNRANIPSNTYSRHATRRSSGIFHNVESLTPPWLPSREDGEPRAAKRPRLSASREDVGSTREESESPKQVVRVREIRNEPSMAVVAEFRRVEDMMNPTSAGRRTFRRPDETQSTFASSPDELSSSRKSLRLQNSKSPRPMRLEVRQVPKLEMAPRSSSNTHSSHADKRTIDTTADEIEDSEPERQRVVATRISSMKKDKDKESSGPKICLRSQTEILADDDEDELAQNLHHTRPMTRSTRIPNGDSHRSNSAGDVLEISPDSENHFKPAIFRTADSADVQLKDRLKIKTFLSWRYKPQDKDLDFLEYNRDSKEWTLVTSNTEPKEIPLAKIVRVTSTQEDLAVCMDGDASPDTMAYWCYMQFPDTDNYSAFIALLQSEHPDLTMKLESSAQVQSQLRRRLSGMQPTSERNKGIDKVISKMKDKAELTKRPTQARAQESFEITHELPESLPPSRRTRNSTSAARARPPTPPLPKYSMTHGLGKKWSDPLLYPRKGAGRAAVDFEDLRRLDEGDMLNDQLIYFCLRYAQVKSVDSAKRVYIFNSFFYESMSKSAPGRKINYDKVKNWTRRVNIFKDYDYVVIPINENFHWYAVIICNTSRIRPQTVQSIEDDDDSTEESPKSQRLRSSAQETRSTTNSNLPIQESNRKSRSSSTDASLSRQAARISFDETTLKTTTRATTTDATEPSTGKDSAALLNPQPGPTTTSRGKTIEEQDSCLSRTSADTQDVRPFILYLDSLKMPHATTTTKLKSYLEAEAKTKQGWDCIDLSARSVNEKSVPGQDNLSDCGVYLVGYISKFLKDPEGFMDLQAQGKLGDNKIWKSLKPSVMRNNMRSMIQHERKVMVAEGATSSGTQVPEVVRAHPPILASAYDEFTWEQAKVEAEHGSKVTEQPTPAMDKERIRKARESKFFTSPVGPNDFNGVSRAPTALAAVAKSAPTTPLPTMKNDLPKKVKKPLIVDISQVYSSSPMPTSDDASPGMKRKARPDEVETEALPSAKRPARENATEAILESSPPETEAQVTHRRKRSNAEIAKTAQQTLRVIRSSRTELTDPSPPTSSAPSILIEDSQDADTSSKPRSNASKTNQAVVDLDEEVLGDSRA